MINRVRVIFLAASCAAFVPAAHPNDLIFRGNLHSSIGNATLSINSFDQLVVDDFAPAGRFGVSIDLGQAESFDLYVVPQPAGLPIGANERFVARGTVAAVPNVSYANFEFTRGATSMAVDASFAGLGFSPRVVEVYMAGTLVGSFTTTSAAAQVATVPPSAWPRMIGIRRDQLPFHRPAVLCKWPAPLPIALTGGPILSGDELRVVALIPTNTLDLVARVDGTGSDVPELFISEEDTQPVCPGDLDGDGDVDLADLSIVLAHFGASEGVTAADGDIDHDGDVDLSDLSVVLANFGSSCN